MAYLNARARQERAYVLRELLLRPALKLRENPSTDYTAAITDLTDELVVTATNGVMAISTTDMLGKPDDRRHYLIAAARLIMSRLETATGRAMPKAALTTTLTARGFTPNVVNAALAWLTEQSLITVTNGTVTDISGDRRPTQPRSPLPAELLAPRTTAPSSSTPAPSTPATRPNMPVGGLVEHPDKLDMAARLRAQAESMPNPSFEVGDIPAAAASTVKKDEKPAAPVITDSAIVAYMEALTDVFARAGKPTVALSELSVRFPAVELPEGVTEQAALSEAARRMRDNGTLRRDGDAITHVPAEKAVSTLAAWLSDAALPGKTITVAALSARENAQALTPSGWRTETIATLALDAVVASGVMEQVDGGWMKPAPAKPAPTPEPEAPAPAPKPEAVEPAGDTTSSTTAPKPKGVEPVAPASGQRTEGKAHTAPVSNTALEKKVDVLTGEVRAIGKRLHTLPPPPTKEQVMLADADPLARRVLETVLVQLKVTKRVAEEDEKEGKKEPNFVMTRDDLKSRVPGRARRTATNPNPPDLRQYLDAALEVGRAMGVIECTDTRRGGSYIFISHVNVMSRAELDRRVQRVLDIRAARAEKQDAA